MRRIVLIVWHTLALYVWFQFFAFAMLVRPRATVRRLKREFEQI